MRGKRRKPGVDQIDDARRVLLPGPVQVFGVPLPPALSPTPWRTGGGAARSASIRVVPGAAVWRSSTKWRHVTPARDGRFFFGLLIGTTTGRPRARDHSGRPRTRRGAIAPRPSARRRPRSCHGAFCRQQSLILFPRRSITGRAWCRRLLHRNFLRGGELRRFAADSAGDFGASHYLLLRGGVYQFISSACHFLRNWLCRNLDPIMAMCKSLVSSDLTL